MKKLTLENFIIKANLIHKNTYDYSFVIYDNTKIKIKILCKKHGIFEQTPDSHLHGAGCFKCGLENTKQKQIKNCNDFINEANITHDNKYNYSISQYIGARKKIKIICKKHGIFEQTPDSHLRGSGCPKCVNRNTTTNEFIERANIVHNYSYNYDYTNYINPRTKIKIVCNKHGAFEQQPNSHLRGSGCPVCKSSKGEKIVANFLKLNNIQFIKEKKFNNCKNKYHLPFDFYLPRYNILIEYDGEQHEKPINFNGISNEMAELNFQKIKYNDNIKNKYANDNNIKLIRISYKLENLEEFLKNNLKCYSNEL